MKRIAMVWGWESGHSRSVLAGVARYREEKHSFTIGRILPDRRLTAHLTAGRYDGAITFGFPRETTPAMFAAARCPVVTVNRDAALAQVIQVDVDDHRVGALAAEHLYSRGLRHLAYVGVADLPWSRIRCQGFMDWARKNQCACSEFHVSGVRMERLQSSSHARTWLKNLPRPTGLMAGYDGGAWFVLELCRTLGITVPDDLAIIGADNDHAWCLTAHPQITSVDTNPLLIGYRAAETLDAMLRGETVAPLTLTEPAGVVVRASTDIVGVPDPIVARAVRLIRDRVRDGINVDDVLQELLVSRSTLERKFVQSLGHTPLEAIHRARVAVAASLLLNTDMPIDRVATACGCTSASRLDKLFRTITGLTPRDYRRKHAQPALPPGADPITPGPHP